MNTQDDIKPTAVDFQQTERQMAVLTQWLIIATGAVAAVIVNAFAGAGDHPHLAAMFLCWFAPLPFFVFGLFYAGTIYFGQYKLFYRAESDHRPKWLIALADYLISKTPLKIRKTLHWTAETYLFIFGLFVVVTCFVSGTWLFVEGTNLFLEVNSLQYKLQLQSLTSGSSLL
jgi:hypothetical protein